MNGEKKYSWKRTQAVKVGAWGERRVMGLPEDSEVPCRRIKQ